MHMHVPNTPQQLFIMCGVCSLIISFPIGNGHEFIMKDPRSPTIDPIEEDISPSRPSHRQNVNVHQRADFNLHTCPRGIDESVAKVVKHQVHEVCYETLKVNPPPRLHPQKSTNGGKRHKVQPQQHKQTLDVVDERIAEYKCQLQIALEIDEQRKITNMTATQW